MRKVVGEWFRTLLKWEVEVLVYELLEVYGPEVEEILSAVEELATEWGLEEEEVEELKAHALRVLRREVGE